MGLWLELRLGFRVGVVIRVRFWFRVGVVFRVWVSGWG